MKNKAFTIFFVLLLAVMTACEKDPPIKPKIEDGSGSLELSFRGFVSGESFVVGEVFKDITGRSFRIDGLRFYVTDIFVINEDGSESLLQEVALIDFSKNHTGASGKVLHEGIGENLYFDLPPGKYRGVRLGIGVVDRLNAEGPSAFDTDDHPLGVNNGMHWSWASGYKFVELSGKVDTSLVMDSTKVNAGFEYHTGMDTLYRELNFDGYPFEMVIGEEQQIILEFDIAKWFYNDQDTIDLRLHSFTHTVPMGSVDFDLAQSMTDNLANTVHIKIP